MANLPGQKRGELSKDEMRSMVVHRGWVDGREGFVFCRLDAVICADRLLRAELTWNDDGESKEDNMPTSYFDPMLTIESNRLDRNDWSRWVTHDAIHIDISGDLAAELASKPPTDVLGQFAAEVAGLRLWKGSR